MYVGSMGWRVRTKHRELSGFDFVPARPPVGFGIWFLIMAPVGFQDWCVLGWNGGAADFDGRSGWEPCARKGILRNDADRWREVEQGRFLGRR